MLSIFPDLFSFGILGVFLIRISIGLFLLYKAFFLFYKEKNKNRNLSVWTQTLLFKVSGLLIIIGLFTQIAVLVAIVVLFWNFISSPKNKDSFWLLVITVSCLILLLLNGAGPFAFDLPF